MFGLSKNKQNTDKNYLIEQNQKLNVRLEAIAEVNKSLVGVVDRQKVFDLITRKLAPSVKMNFPSIWLYDEELGRISLVSHSIPDSIRMIAETAMGKKISELYFSKDVPEEKNSTYFKVIETAKPIYSNDLYEHTRPFLNQQAAKVLELASGIKLAVSVPIMVEGKPLGILSAIWKEPVLSKEDDITLFTFANQISTAIYNAQLFDRVTGQVTLLESQNHDLSSLFNLTTRIVQSLDPKKVTQNAVDSLPQNDFMSGGIILDYDEKARTTKVVAATTNQLSEKVSGLIGDFSRFVTSIDDPNAQTSPAVKAVKYGEMAYSNNLHDIIAPLPKAAADIVARIINVKSVVAYPIRSRGKVVGAIAYFIKDKEYDQLENNKKQLLTTYTLQITIALENANLYNESQLIQQNLQDALYQLKEARRQERDMLDVMGHELRTPISIVRNALVMVDKQVLEHKATNVSLAKYLDMALESTRREITLIETLLSATKVDSARMQLYYTKVDMKDVVSDGIEGQATPLSRKNLKLVYTPPTEDVFVYSDRTRMQEIMDNLYSNAIKYTNQGQVEIKLWQDAEHGYLSIADSGVGISEEDLQQLGHKFFRARQYVEDHGGSDSIIRPGGTGLGLYVTFDLVRIMGGTLYINSKLGEGSTFTVSMPRFNGQADKQVDETFDNEDSEKRNHIVLNGNAPTPAQ
jgi:signal transduction histidine kinase